jgi:hypothetical protein
LATKDLPMTVYYVTHIRVDGPDNDCRIDRLKGYDTNGREWADSLDGIIKLVKAEWDFRTNHNGVSERIGVWVSSAGREYLKTYANGRWTDNLEALPRF